MLANYLHTEPNPRWKIALLTVLFMGLRRGELAGLEWKDIDYENKTMTIARSVQDIIFAIFCAEQSVGISEPIS